MAASARVSLGRAGFCFLDDLESQNIPNLINILFQQYFCIREADTIRLLSLNLAKILNFAYFWDELKKHEQMFENFE